MFIFFTVMYLFCACIALPCALHSAVTIILYCACAVCTILVLHCIILVPGTILVLYSPVHVFQVENMRYLVKQGLVVERVGSQRKLRHLFVFKDVVVGAKQRMSNRYLSYNVS